MSIFGELDLISQAPDKGRRGRSLLPFFENKKKCPDFAEKDSDSVHLWVKYSIQNVVLRVSRRKSIKKGPRRENSAKPPMP